MNSDLFHTIDNLLDHNKRIILSIDGCSGSGKSVLAERLKQHYGCAVIHMDDFFLPPNLRTRERLQEVGGNIDYDRFKTEVSDNLNSGSPFFYGVYDCAVMAVTKKSEIPAVPLTVVEGVYSLHPNLHCHYDLKILLTLPREEQLKRIKNRSGEGMLSRFIGEWIPMEDRYFKEMEIASKCDVLLSGKDISAL